MYRAPQPGLKGGDGPASPRHRGAALRYNPAMAGRANSSKRGLTVAVTGPTGEIGRAVVEALGRASEVGRIRGMARRPFDARAAGLRKLSYTRGDVLDREAVDGLVKDADVVVHLAFMIMGGAAESREVNL